MACGMKTHGEHPRVVLRQQRQAVHHPRCERPAEAAGLRRPPVDVDAQQPHRHDGDVEAGEVRVEEHARHQPEQDRRHEPAPPPVRACAEEVGDPQREPPHAHAREAEGRAPVGEDRVLLVQVGERQAEEVLHQDRVLVVVREDAAGHRRVEGLPLARRTGARTTARSPGPRGSRKPRLGGSRASAPSRGATSRRSRRARSRRGGRFA